jgi:hypothetical protein
MTAEEEARSRRVSDLIRVVDTAPPPADWVRRLEELERLAEDGEPAAVVAALRALVPRYTPDERWGATPPAVAGLG